MYYYAILNRNGVITSTYASPIKMRTSRLLVEINVKDMGAVGKQFWACSTDNVQYLNTTKSLSDKLAEMDSLLSAEGGNVAALVSEVADVKAIAERADTATDRLDTQLASLSNEVGGVEDSVGSVSHRVGQLEADYTETKAKTEEAINGNNSAIAEHTAEITENRTEIDRIDKNVEAVIHTVNDHESVINSLEGQVDNLTEATNDNTVAIQKDINNLDGRVTANAGDIAALIGSMNNAESDISAVSARVTNAFSDIGALDGAVTKLGARTTAVENRATALESSVATNKTNITSVTNKANTNATNISNLTTSMTTAEKNINANKKDIAAIKTGYLPIAGGTVSGDLNVDGVIRVNGSQAFFFNEEAATMNIGTNNATTVNLAGVHSGGTMNVNSAMFRPYSVIPRNSDSLLGNTNFRWKGIYSQAAVNVSSDERLKKDIAETDRAELADFIGKLPVKTFKYKDDEALELDRIGLIAQDVMKASPSLARYFVSAGGDGYYGLKPADLVFPLIAAVQQLQDEVNRLKK